MADLNASYILQGQAPDVVGQLMRGSQAAQQTNQVRQQNALAQLYQTQGAGIMNGDQGALNALAGISPDAALGIQQNRLGMDATRQDMGFQSERMQMARDQAKQQAAEYAKGISAQEAAQHAAEVERGVAAAATAKTPEQWDQIAQQFGAPELVGQFANRDAVIGSYMGIAEVMKQRSQTPDPLKGAPTGYMFNEAGNPAAGVSMLPGYTPTKGGVTINNNPDGNSGAFLKKADELAAGRYDSILSEGKTAQQFSSDMSALATLAPRIGTGKGAELVAALGPYAEAVGVSVDGLSEAQAYKAIVDRLAPNMRPAGAGATSDFDAKQFLSALPGLGKTPEGNAIIIATLQALQDQKMKAAGIANLVMSGEKTWQEGDAMIAALGNPYEGFKQQGKTEKPQGSVLQFDADGNLVQ